MVQIDPERAAPVLIEASQNHLDVLLLPILALAGTPEVHSYMDGMLLDQVEQDLEHEWGGECTLSSSYVAHREPLGFVARALWILHAGIRPDLVAPRSLY